MLDERRLDLGRREPVAGDVDDVVDPAHEPVSSRRRPASRRRPVKYVSGPYLEK